MKLPFNYSFSPLGDAALLIDFGNRMDREVNESVLDVFNHLQNNRMEGVHDIVPAYSSLAIFYDPGYFAPQKDKTIFETMVEKLDHQLRGYNQPTVKNRSLIRIPICCSEAFAWDLGSIAAAKNIPPEEVISIFTANTYRVYMLGFLPGFPYMGEVDESIATDRKNEPRTKVAAGSVGIAGRQTGIYPVESPGGWQIIGRTPLTIFNKDHKDPVVFHPGDEVIFYPVSSNEFENYQAGHS